MSESNSINSTVYKTKEALSSILEKLKSAKDKKFVFLLIGRTGVGKSSTINSLMGKEIAQVGHYEPTTMKVKYYESEINGIDFTVIDTPGLCDEIEEAGNDEKYLEDMRSKVKHIDSMWFVSRLDDTRVTADEKRGIKLISNTFSPKVWEHAVIVFTHANSMAEPRYQEALEKRTELIKREIGKYASANIVDSIPSVGVDNTSKTTPDKEEWLGELYTKVFLRISDHGIIPFLMATADSVNPPQTKPQANKQNNNNSHSNNSHSHSTREHNRSFHTDTFGKTQKEEKWQEPRIKINEVQKKVIRKKIIDAGIIPTLATTGSVIGAGFGPVGAAIGGAVGAVVGFIAWLGF